ncbi:MAG TPA: DUF721 domain-containing protein [Methylothermaceae bacterium]|nr:DUF721 domain-containing protein [Methylothermaceae bacterium]
MSSDAKEKSGAPVPVGQMLRQSSVLSVLEARAQLHQKLLRQIQASLPDRLSSHCLACVLRGDGLLVVYTDSPAWASQLRFSQAAILSGVTSAGPVRQIKIRILNSSVTRGGKPAPGSVKVPGEVVLKQLLNEARCSPDEEIKQALMALVEAMRNRLQVNKLEGEAPPGTG